jgi:c-di-GMP-binding flagellar brake protein YcgR
MQTATMFIERRNYPRIQVKVPIKYRVLDDQKEIQSLLERKEKEISTQTIDLSIGGLYIASEEKLLIGSILRLEMAFSENQKSLSAFAEVVWTNSSGGGVHFLAVQEENVEFLRTYISKFLE